MQTVPRLYNSFIPHRYSLKFSLDTFSSDRRVKATATIRGQQIDPGTILLHAKDLAVSRITVDDTSCEFSSEGDTLTISHHSSEQEDVVISIDYELTVTDGMHGIYPCYFEYEGQKKELIATQFESHHAREAFPCVDEPEAKAIFDIMIISQPGIEVLGNMPIKHQEINEPNGLLHTQFLDTPYMSPYLVAFVLGDLQKKSGSTKNGTEVNIYATRAQSSDSLDFALDTAIKSIEFFNDYFDTAYPLPKCDHVALPDFSSGAMENWGLITYREMCLLVDKSSAIATREYVATVIAHETSHQWFGNLVTMQWWDDLWLNESFATLMEYTAVDAIHPDWNMWLSYATHESLSALRRDYLPGVQSVKVSVNHPDEISSLFDPSIVYAKGARLLKMLHSYIGEAAFRDGLKHYFKEYAYKNTKGNDLWKAFSEATGLDISEFMNSWLEQPNLPVVRVTKDTNGYHLEQSPFVLGGSTKDTIWPIPLGARRDDIPQLLDSKEISVQAESSLVLLNQGNSAHFVTQYDDDLLAKITYALNKGIVSTVDRLSLLHETSLLARSGHSSASQLYKLLSSFKDEHEEAVWDIMSMVIGDLKLFVYENESHELIFKQKIIDLALPQFIALGWDEVDGESESQTKLRATIIGLLAYCDFPDVINEGLKRFHAHQDNIAELPGELRGIICSIAVKHGVDGEASRLFDLYSVTNIADLQQDISSSLCTTRDQTMIDKLLSALTDSSVVRPQDVDRWFVYLIRNRYAREKSWQWMCVNWDWITTTFESDKSYDFFPRYSASALSSYEWKERYDTFFEPLRDVPALTRAIELGSADIAGRASWINRDQAAFIKLLIG